MLAMSRRSLEIRFERAMGRTLHREICRVRLERAKRLLQETDLPLDKVAAGAGFNTASYLTQVFKKHIDMTPAQYRRSNRGEFEL